MKQRLFYIKNIILIVILVGIDQYTKILATTNLKGSSSTVLIKNFLSLQLLDGGNKGAAFGLLQNKRLLFIVITVLAVLLIAKFLYNIYKIYVLNNYSLNIKYRMLEFAEVVLISGAIGNLIDRIKTGVVCDFIQFDFINFPLFNVADCYVTVSAIIIFFVSIFALSEKEFANVFRIKKSNSNGD